MRTHETELLTRAAALNVWSHGKRRAPHKPLLLLLAVGRAQQGLPRTAPWTWWREPLTKLLKEYAPNTKSRPTPHNPFRFLISDELWEVAGYDPADQTQFVAAKPGNAEETRAFRIGWLNENDPAAGLPAEYHNVLAEEPAAADRLVRLLIQLHFPPTVWPDVLSDTGVIHDLQTVVGLPEVVARKATSHSRRTVRDPQFAAKVIAADQGRCVVCQFDGRDDHRDRPVGLDAAHVEWHNVGGPDSVTNGAALCSTHHRLFDRGMFCWHPETRVLVVSDHYRNHARTARLPEGLPAPDRLDSAHLSWQLDNVFRH